MNVNLVGAGQAGDDFMATTMFQGAYNQKQLSTRLYLSVGGDDPYWLSHAVPSNVTVSQFSFSTTDPDGALKALLSTHGSSIAGYYICDPFNAPETCNMAMTLGGINDSMVVNPDNLTCRSILDLPRDASALNLPDTVVQQLAPFLHAALGPENPDRR